MKLTHNLYGKISHISARRPVIVVLSHRSFSLCPHLGKRKRMQNLSDREITLHVRVTG